MTRQANGEAIAGSSATASTDKKTAKSASSEVPKAPPPRPARELGAAQIEHRGGASSGEERTPQR